MNQRGDDVVYQIGVWTVRRDGQMWTAAGPGTVFDGKPQSFESLTAAYEKLAGEPLSFEARLKLHREWTATPLGAAFIKFEDACAAFWQLDGDDGASPAKVKRFEATMTEARAELLEMIRGW